MMIREKAACEQVQALMADIFKSGSSFSVIFSDIINYTDNVAKEDVFRKKILGIRVLASVIQNKRRNTVRNFI